MPSADQVPVKTSHSTMLWHMWVVLIAGSTGSALRAVRTLHPHITPDGCPARSLLRRECDGFLVSLASGHHCPSHSGDLVGERDGGDLRRSPRQQSREPRPVLGAVNLGVTDHGQRAGGEQAAQIAIALLADTAELFPAPTRVLLGHEPDPGREVPS